MEEKKKWLINQNNNSDNTIGYKVVQVSMYDFKITELNNWNMVYFDFNIKDFPKLYWMLSGQVTDYNSGNEFFVLKEDKINGYKILIKHWFDKELKWYLNQDMIKDLLSELEIAYKEHTARVLEYEKQKSNIKYPKKSLAAKEKWGKQKEEGSDSRYFVSTKQNTTDNQNIDDLYENYIKPSYIDSVNMRINNLEDKSNSNIAHVYEDELMQYGNYKIKNILLENNIKKSSQDLINDLKHKLHLYKQEEFRKWD